MGLPSCRPTTDKGGDQRWGPWLSDPGSSKLALGTWNGTSLPGKEPELMPKVERYQLYNWAQNTSFGTNLPESGWKLFFSVVAHGEWRRTGVGLLMGPRLDACVSEFQPVDERVAFLHLQVGEQALTFVCV